jgi:hypothetical protein
MYYPLSCEYLKIKKHTPDTRDQDWFCKHEESRYGFCDEEDCPKEKEEEGESDGVL